MTRPHPDPSIRRAVRVLRMVSELHVAGFQFLRGMPYLSGSGIWRLEIRPKALFHRSHGALLWAPNVFEAGWQEFRDIAEVVARYSAGGAAEGIYFEWEDAAGDDARALAAKFVDRFPALALHGSGWDYEYAGWFQRLVGTAEQGWMPIVFHSDLGPSLAGIQLQDVRPKTWKGVRGPSEALLPLPPPGDLERDWQGS